VIEPLASPSLLLLPLTLEDAPAIQEHFPRWEIVRHLAKEVPWPYPADGALTFLREIALPARDRGDAWQWSLRLRELPGQLIGVASLRRGDRDNRGLWVGRPWQGRGLGREACRVLERYWFEVLGFPVLRIPKVAANAPSRRLSERAGMRVVESFQGESVSGRQPMELWELTFAEWKRREAERPHH
jgi:RimJ/RimL family protein N-acetyltransferase